jgi:hypothetical protein
MTGFGPFTSPTDGALSLSTISVYLFFFLFFFFFSFGCSYYISTYSMTSTSLANAGDA